MQMETVVVSRMYVEFRERQGRGNLNVKTYTFNFKIFW